MMTRSEVVAEKIPHLRQHLTAWQAIRRARAEEPNDSCGSKEAADRYALSRMCAGPYYEARTHTLRAPHRYSNKRIAAFWFKCGFQLDRSRYEFFKDYTRFSPDEITPRVAACRQRFYQLWSVSDARVKPTEAVQ